MSACIYSNLAGRLRRSSRFLTRLAVLVACACATVGGDQGRVEIHLIAQPDDDQSRRTEARRLLTGEFATFDAAKAQCFLTKDREHLLAVIEAGFGDFDDFNRSVRSLITSRLYNHELELSSRSSLDESSHGSQTRRRWSLP